jgi:REP element-mobilizing transposase RayT
MGWPLRMFDAEGIYFVTVRCFQGRLLLRPSKQTNAVLAGVLARAARLSSIELFGFVFASNHFHLIVRAPQGNLPRFMQFLTTNVSKKVGWLVGWGGAFWERRYSAVPILDQESLFGRLRYVLAHGVKERLVRRCVDWPGLSSLPMMLGSPTRSARWFNWTKRWQDRGRVGVDRYSDEWAETEQLTLTPLPGLAARLPAAQRMLCKQAVADIEREAALDRSPVLGVRKVLAQSPQFRPFRLARRAPPLCFVATEAFRRIFRERYREYVTRFREASGRWRRGVLNAVFPEGAVRPCLWPVPSLAAA